jgi:hypothetical protein
MAILIEPVHQGEYGLAMDAYDGLATDAWKRFNEVKGNICPNPVRHQ